MHEQLNHENFKMWLLSQGYQPHQADFLVYMRQTKNITKVLNPNWSYEKISYLLMVSEDERFDNMKDVDLDDKIWYALTEFLAFGENCSSGTQYIIASMDDNLYEMATGNQNMRDN